MSKFLALFIFLAGSFFGFYSDDSAPKKFSVAVPIATRIPIYCPPPVIALEKTLLTASCSNGVSSNNRPDDGLITRLTVTAVAPECNALNYRYTVSGGQIIGEGAEVSWDLKGFSPGTYQINVDIIDNKSGKTLQSASKTVTVEACNDDGDRCLGACPSLSVDAPSSPVQAGETMMFTANVSGGVVDKITYDWTVSDGKIIEGQGTPIIRVATNSEMIGKTIEVTANFKWNSDCWEICNKTALASGLVAAKKGGKK